MLPTLASGLRDRTSGALGNVGTNGYSWSSSPLSGSASAGFLLFESGNVNPLHADGRSYGFPVRCVQHLQDCFSKVEDRRRVRFLASGLSSLVFMT
ncbi:MAG: hypothetical protein NC209_08050 [Alistipes sp.]|nr:hypothetical protein [Alistipes sp.]